MHKRKILIADDEPSIRRLIHSTLEDDVHCEIHEASDGRETLEQLRSFAPDVLILDLMMPHLSGLNVLEELNNHPLAPRPRVIVLSAKVTEEERALELGAQLFLRKPFSPLQLMDLVEQALQADGAALP